MSVDQWLGSFEEALASGDACGRGRSCSPTSATGATSSPSPGTSRPSRAGTRCGTCSTPRSTRVQPQRLGPRRGRRPTADGVTEAWITFETDVGRGYGLSAAEERQDLDAAHHPGRAQGPRGAEGPAPAAGARRTAHRRAARPGRRSARRRPRTLGYETQPYVVIIGGGQGGIALGARLRQLGVPTIIVERNERPGDCWRKRYKSLCLHDPVWYDHLPYIDFPKNWPVFSPKDKIGDWLEMYTKVMELNYWSCTDRQVGAVRRGQAGMDRHGRARRPGDRAAAEAARVRDRHVGQAEHSRTSRAWRASRASSTTRPSIPARTATSARRSW